MFNVVFKGEISSGHDLEIVKQKFAKIFNLSTEKTISLFSGKPIVIKKNLIAVDGIKLQQQLLNIGAITHLVLITPIQHVAPASNIDHSIQPKKHIPPLKQQELMQPTPHLESLTLQPIAESVIYKDDPSEAESEPKTESFFSRLNDINFSAIILSFSFWASILLMIISITSMIIFSPYPDFVIRKGFVIGGFLLFFGMLKFKRSCTAS